MRIVLFMFLALSLFGCASIEKQNNINKAMENYQFNYPASEVYEAAAGKFNRMLTPITKVKNFEGVSEWRVTEADPKFHANKSRTRFKVLVEGNNNSTLKVFKEDEDFLLEKWSGQIHSNRVPIYEYNVLEILDPAKAKEIEAAAEK